MYFYRKKLTSFFILGAWNSKMSYKEYVTMVRTQLRKARNRESQLKFSEKTKQIH